ncbi:MAG: hypothetical protein JWR50_1061, partial [Mucilaginibacter sp.]|nr:hypothetical protein [Mucilaginibacter sp.]
HTINIATHVPAGSLALIAGLTAAVVSKTGKWHVRFGRYFMWMIIVVILTGLFGIFVFNRNNFLLVITMLSGYACFSGIRSIRLNGQKPKLLDCLVPILAIASAMYYLYYVFALGMYWSPVITYSTLGTLLLLAMYDLLKTVLSVTFLKKAIMYEHAYKMITALTAIASAFIGTVFPQYKPYSQFMPSVTGVVCIIIAFVWLSNKPEFYKNAEQV